MKRMRKTPHRSARIAALCALATWITACDCFDYHPYCVDISGETHINEKNIKKIAEITEGRDSFRFAFISDTQRWYDETEDMVEDINRRDDIDFVIHGGDFTDFGANDEFLWQRDILQGLDVPYVALIGNHDCLATGKQTFNKVWGALDFAFTAGDVRFICLNTNALEFDYSNPVPDMNFIYSEMKNFPGECTRSIIVQHCKPYDEQFNNNMAVFYHMVITNLPGAMCALSGHTHKIEDRDIFGDEFMYHSTTCAADRKYLIFTITKEGYTHETVSF